MPQMGWFEILIVVVLAVLIVGPKDFPIMIRKIGSWVGSIKRYFSEIQADIADMESSIDDDVSVKEKFSKKNQNIKKDD